jgi:DNA-binding PadR family transcriptional regulator
MTIRHALLALLADGPKHGFQLANGFEAGTGDMWPLNTGQVYTTLQRLERDGLVEPVSASDDGEEPNAQNVFQLTAAGHTELFDWLRTPPDLSTPPREELVIKVLVALRVPGIDVVELTQTHRRHLIDVMVEYTRIKQHAAEDDIGLLLVADAEIFRLEALVRWLDAADVRIKRLEAPLPLPAGGGARRPARRKAGARR